MKTPCTASWIYAKLRLYLKYKIAKKVLFICRITDIQIHRAEGRMVVTGGCREVMDKWLQVSAV